MRRTLRVLATSLALAGAVPAAAHAVPAEAGRAASSTPTSITTPGAVRTTPAVRKPTPRTRVVDVTGDAGFVTPTGGIACYLGTTRTRGRTSVSCDVLAPHAWRLATPKNCPAEHIQGMSLFGRGAGGRACVGDTFLLATAVGAPATSWFTPARGVVVRVERNRLAGLRYGHALRLGDTTCSSAATGVTCTNTTGHGFVVSRQTYRTW